MPAMIILYKDRVSDGQIDYAIEHVIKTIGKCFNNEAPRTRPRTYRSWASRNSNIILVQLEATVTSVNHKV